MPGIRKLITTAILLASLTAATAACEEKESHPLASLEQELEADSAPWTPARIPDWSAG